MWVFVLTTWLEPFHLQRLADAITWMSNNNYFILSDEIDDYA